MKSIEEVVNNRKQNKAKEEEYTRISSEYKKAAYSSADKVSQAISEMRQEMADMSMSQRQEYLEAMKLLISEISNTSKPETNVNLNLQGIEKIQVKSIDIVGFTETIGDITKSLDKVTQELKAMEIKVPPIHVPPMPSITIPKPEVTVNIPPITVPKAEVTISREKEGRLVEYTPQYDSFGNLVRMTEIYDDGTKRIASWGNNGKVTVSYD